MNFQILSATNAPCYQANGSRMLLQHISHWDDAYANGANIPDGERWPAAWVQPAQAYRDELQKKARAQLDLGYSEKARNRFDLFLPDAAPKGLVIFVHGDRKSVV